MANQESDPLAGIVPNADSQVALSVDELMAQICASLHHNAEGHSAFVQEIEAHAPSFAMPSPPLPKMLQAALQAQGIEQLYSHQSQAIEQVRQGRNVVVVTPTSSGKTLCYNLPILESVLHDRSTRALYIYPINALVNDQLKSLMRLSLSLGAQAAGLGRYTGALNSIQRQAVRERQPHIMLTNPEMIHYSFLLWHKNWIDLWSNLKYIVVDEVHTYRGVFGSNMAHLFRRVLRMAHHYGAAPQFICCSATIANPGELTESLTGLPFSVITDDGAGSARKHFVLWNPPYQGDPAENVRRSYADESVDLMLRCVRADYNTILFTRSRSLTERMLRQARALVEEQGRADLVESISAYRAGYLADEREEIENGLKSGAMRGVITTNALELGIDIGGLDAAVIAGYPGTIMSTWQQAGRAGRRGRDALVVMVASQNPLDQYYVHHPEQFFALPHEIAVLDLHNQPILLKHLLCAAKELPLNKQDIAAFDPELLQPLQELLQRGLLAPIADDGAASGELGYPQDRKQIHFQVSLRSASHNTYRILDEKRHEIGTIEPPNVFRETHPGAIYQHAGEDYRVTYLDRREKTVRVQREEAPHYTRACSTLSLTVDQVVTSREIDVNGLTFKINLGDVLVRETVHSYQEMVLGSDELVKRVNLSQPLVMRLHTSAMWIELSPMLRDALLAQMHGLPLPLAEPPTSEMLATLGDGLHAAQHLLTGVIPLLVMCDRRDVNGYYDLAQAELGNPALFIYDAYEGGIGLADIAYEQAEQMIALARDTVDQCQCREGCPSCVQSSACRFHNEGLNKDAAMMILAALSDQFASHGVGWQDRRVAMPPARQAGQGQTLDMGWQRAIDDLDHRTLRLGLRVNPTKVEQAPPEPEFAKGDQVVHNSWGPGRVTATRMEGHTEFVTVRFQRRGMVRELDASKGVLRKA